MSAQAPRHSLVVRRQFRAPRGLVFEAWTTPEHLEQWWGPLGHKTHSAEVDLQKGGAYRLSMETPTGQGVAIVGTFVDIEPERRLVYTWAFEGEGYDAEETLVTVEFLALGGQTEVVLTHERLPSQEAVDHHEQGWRGCLDGLETMLGTA